MLKELRGRDGITDYGDTLSLVLNENESFTVMCAGETTELTFDGSSTRVLLTCGGYSGGFRAEKPVHLMLLGDRPPKNVVFPYEICGERYAILRIPADRMSAAVLCRDRGQSTVDPDGPWDRFVFP